VRVRDLLTPSPVLEEEFDDSTQAMEMHSATIIDYDEFVVDVDDNWLKMMDIARRHVEGLRPREAKTFVVRALPTADERYAPAATLIRRVGYLQPPLTRAGEIKIRIPRIRLASSTAVSTNGENLESVDNGS
jgi:hypothetical protein